MASSGAGAIYDNMSQKSTEELLEIWKSNNQDAWSPEALDAIREILTERNISIPTRMVHRQTETAVPTRPTEYWDVVFLAVGLLLHVLMCNESPLFKDYFDPLREIILPIAAALPGIVVSLLLAPLIRRSFPSHFGLWSAIAMALLVGVGIRYSTYFLESHQTSDASEGNVFDALRKVGVERLQANRLAVVWAVSLVAFLLRVWARPSPPSSPS